ncbi:MAG TPA: aminotransferase class V-fold PLP-dependent enzyme [Phycisphaerae bacterium]|nr:aminotransferase class V-fold PLP-dependent enzyme [Phycisphaerae bacterium]HRR84270.1 aminotransferase class V-fold PLP-dependent enzyme [Phycisphaerae bacterium]
MNVRQLRELFPITRRYNFLNAAAVAPLSSPASQAMCRYIEHTCGQATIGADFYMNAEQTRSLAAALIGADPDEVTFTKNTTEGIGWVAGGLPWRAGDNVVITAVEFPANVYPWMGLGRQGVDLRMVKEVDGRVPAEDVIAAIDERTRVVSVSAVQYASGFRMDLPRLGQVCRERDVLLCVDAIQALGVLPIDVRAMQIDFLSADGHKWLCGPEGCGIFYCRRELLDRLTPVFAGWLCMEDALDFGNYRFEFLRSARKFDTGSYNLAGICGLGASIEMWLEAGIDVVAQWALALTDRLVEGVRGKGYRVVSSRLPGEASSIVAFVSDHHDHGEIRKRLQEQHRVIISCREGRLRASPHAYNTLEEIDQLIELLPGH